MESLSPAALQSILDDIAAAMAQRSDRGQPASYIPELGRVSPQHFGIALCLPGGQTLLAGEATTRFSIQSISKVFTLAIALGRLGDDLWQRVGREPSGAAFNSIVSLEHDQGIPRNPFINAGAIAVTDAILEGLQPRDVLAELLRFLRVAAGDEDIHIDKTVAASERAHAHRNTALAEFMAAHGNLRNPAALTIGTYCHQCAVEMTCVQLARAGRFLAGLPAAPRLVSPARVRRINALMLTCGHYDASGDFAYRVGLPGKSGVGGGILAIAPGRASIAVWSPGLDAQGNSRLGAEAMEHLARATGWSVFG
ncbi:glutaminase [Pseudotabrizicola algicola]|uniref:Glutaminase n=1 Tax=Pseudotabrizicola algicola TaxID=2709381 RepID=A0A6B3RMP5_9RHOB|nr:glutaminase [Pseudotabrizicola algicola]NEX47354.1 glutaminase [Pseudotabrizicola algicola]